MKNFQIYSVTISCWSNWNSKSIIILVKEISYNQYYFEFLVKILNFIRIFAYLILVCQLVSSFCELFFFQILWHKFRMFCYQYSLSLRRSRDAFQAKKVDCVEQKIKLYLFKISHFFFTSASFWHNFRTSLNLFEP